MNEALNDRFITLEFDYDDDIESKIISSKSLRELARDMRNQAIEGKFDSPVSTRMLKAFVHIAQGLGWDMAVETFCNKFSSSEERSAAKLLMETYQWQIMDELGLSEKSVNV